MGYDVHRFCTGRQLILGGVEIPYAFGLDGHSDADVLIHAIMDAVLGAAGKADIGHMFPNTDERFKGASSIDLLKAVMDSVGDVWTIVNVDTVVIAEAPKIAPFIDAMKKNIGCVLNVGSDAVGIKATTNEKMGFVGRREGIAALANVLIQRRMP